MKDILERLLAEGGLLRVRALIAEGVTASVVYRLIVDGALSDSHLAAWLAVAGFYFLVRQNGN